MVAKYPRFYIPLLSINYPRTTCLAPSHFARPRLASTTSFVLSMSVPSQRLTVKIPVEEGMYISCTPLHSSTSLPVRPQCYSHDEDAVYQGVAHLRRCPPECPQGTGTFSRWTQYSLRLAEKMYPIGATIVPYYRSDSKILRDYK